MVHCCTAVYTTGNHRKWDRIKKLWALAKLFTPSFSSKKFCNLSIISCELSLSLFSPAIMYIVRYYHAWEYCCCNFEYYKKNCKCNVILLCKRTLVAVMWRNIFRRYQNAMWDALIHANLSNFLFSQVNEIMFQKPYLWTRLLFHHVNLFWMQYQVCTMAMVKWT